MRVLYFSPRDCWPVTTGARLRDYHLARQLCRGGALLTYLGFAREDAAQADGPGTRPFPELGADAQRVLLPHPPRYSPAKLLRGFLGPQPVSVLNYTTAGMLAELERLCRETSFDVIQMEGVHLAGYAGSIRRFAAGARLVADWHNVESELMARYAGNAGGWPRRAYARRTAALLRDQEDRLLKLCHAHTVCSRREREVLLARAPDARIEVVPNGVDTRHFAEPAGQLPNEAKIDVTFVGSMDYHANIDAVRYFVESVWPLVRARRPELRFVIAGSRPAPEVRALATEPGVTVTGTVDDIRPFYHRALAVVVPLRVGSGTRLKVLEAMAAGAPVVSTTLGVEGLEVSPGEHVLIGDTPQALAEAIAGLEADTRRWHDMAARARALVESHYDWSVAGEALRRLHAELLAGAV